MVLFLYQICERKETQKSNINYTDDPDQLSEMEEKDKNDTEESDLDDYLDDDDDDIDAKWIEEQLEEDVQSEIIDIKEPLKSIRG